jgi:hypothetical protein
MLACSRLKQAAATKSNVWVSEFGIIVKGHNQKVSRALRTNPARHIGPLGFIELIMGIKKIKPIAMAIMG